MLLSLLAKGHLKSPNTPQFYPASFSAELRLLLCTTLLVLPQVLNRTFLSSMRASHSRRLVTPQIIGYLLLPRVQIGKLRLIYSRFRLPNVNCGRDVSQFRGSTPAPLKRKRPNRDPVIPRSLRIYRLHRFFPVIRRCLSFHFLDLGLRSRFNRQLLICLLTCH